MDDKLLILKRRLDLPNQCAKTPPICPSLLNEQSHTHAGEVWSDEDHEDVVEEQEHHERGNDPGLQEAKARQEHGDESKAKQVLDEPGVAGVTLQHPEQDHTHTTNRCDEKQDVGAVLEDGNPIGR